METNKNTSPVIEEKDRNAISLDLMNRMKLHGMASAFRESLNSTMAENMTIDAFLSMLLSQEWDYRSNAAIERLIRAAGFRYKAYPEQIDYTIPRGLDRNQMERLASLEFVRQARNLFITGSSGTGKSFLASALGHEACKKGIRTYYANASKLMGMLKVAKTKGTLETEMKRIERCSLLILDDLFLVPLDAKERPLLLDIIEDRHERHWDRDPPAVFVLRRLVRLLLFVQRFSYRQYAAFIILPGQCEHLRKPKPAAQRE